MPIDTFFVFIAYYLYFIGSIFSVSSNLMKYETRLHYLSNDIQNEHICQKLRH